MFDPTKPVQTRCGYKAEILATDLTGPYPIDAKVWYPDGCIASYRYHSTGWMNEHIKAALDLINIPREFSVTRWVNVYSGESHHVAFHRTRESANENALPGRIACIEVPIKGREGDGL